MGNQTSHSQSSVGGLQQVSGAVTVSPGNSSANVLRDTTNNVVTSAGKKVIVHNSPGDIKDTSLMSDNDATRDYGMTLVEPILISVPDESDTENNHRSMMMESVIKLNRPGGRTSMSPALTLTPIPPSPFAQNNSSPSTAKAAHDTLHNDNHGQTMLNVPTHSQLPLTPRSLSHRVSTTTNPAQVLDFDAALATPSVREPMIRYLSQQHQRPFQLQSPVAMEIDFGESNPHATGGITSSPLPPAIAPSSSTADERMQRVTTSPSFGPSSTHIASLTSPLVLASEHAISPLSVAATSSTAASSSSSSATSSATRARVRIHPTNSYTPPDVLAKLMHATPLSSAPAVTSPQQAENAPIAMQQLSPIPMTSSSPAQQHTPSVAISACTSPLDSSPIIVELPTSPLDEMKVSEPVAPLPSTVLPSALVGPATPASVRLLRSASSMLLDAQQLLKDVEQIKHHVSPPTTADPATKPSSSVQAVIATRPETKTVPAPGQAFIDPELLAFFTPAPAPASTATAVSPVSIQSLQHTGVDASSSSVDAAAFPMLENEAMGESFLPTTSSLVDPIPIECEESPDEFEMLQSSPVGGEAVDPFADAATAIGELEEQDEEGCGFDFASMCFAPASSIIPVEAPAPLSETIASPSPRKFNSRGLRMKWRDLGSDRKSKPDTATLEDDFNYQCQPKLGFTLPSPEEGAPVVETPVVPSMSVEPEVSEEPVPVHVESRRRSRRISSNFSATVPPPTIISPPKSSTAAAITSPTVQMYKVLTKKTRRRSTSFDQVAPEAVEETTPIPIDAEMHEQTEVNDVDSSVVPAVSFSSSSSSTAVTPRSILKATAHPILLLPEPSPVVLRRSSRRATTCEINFDSPPPAVAAAPVQHIPVTQQQAVVAQKVASGKIKSPPPAAHSHAHAVVTSPAAPQLATAARSGRSVHDHCKSACSDFAPVPGMGSQILEKHHRSNSATRAVPNAVNKKQRTSSVTRKPLGDLSNATAH